MKVQNWCNTVWKSQFVIVFLLVLCGFSKAAPKIMYGMRDNFEEDNSYVSFEDLPNYDVPKLHQLQLSPLNIPQSELFNEYMHMQLPDPNYDLDLPNESPPKHPGKKRWIQLCHFKLCNLGRKRATRYLEQIATIDNRKK
ncbi:uncharacterized protein LOC123297391 isoform X2 [Chrysoperla carnea]|uniref:uncharacterized protein LOC123297391 isoform X2 n=1 Tax=Chrysoperla carnea TaxID=189513 RepID=UPI001D094AF2|nr:uncharacterized protein LOC123297391 isoform X2 [Chrysoperla carnea]